MSTLKRTDLCLCLPVCMSVCFEHIYICMPCSWCGNQRIHIKKEEEGEEEGDERKKMDGDGESNWTIDLERVETFVSLYGESEAGMMWCCVAPVCKTYVYIDEGIDWAGKQLELTLF